MTRRRRNSHPKLFLACLLAIGTAIVSPRGKASSAATSPTNVAAAAQATTHGRSAQPSLLRLARASVPALARQ